MGGPGHQCRDCPALFYGFVVSHRTRRRSRGRPAEEATAGVSYMSRLLKLIAAPVVLVLKQPRLAAEIGLVFLIALIWFAGPWVGLESVDGRVQTIIGIVIFRT